jgi:hypothetical protein
LNVKARSKKWGGKLMEGITRAMTDDERRAALHYYLELASRHLASAEKGVDAVGIACDCDMAAYAFGKALRYSVGLQPFLEREELAEIEHAKMLLNDQLDAALERAIEKVNAP